MARVNVEEGAFGDARLTRLERLMGWDHRTALGCLVLLWHESQEGLRDHGTAAEIASWCWALPNETDALVRALAAVGYIVERKDGTFTIQGNSKQIEWRVAQIEKSRKGAEATRARWERLKAQGQAPGHAPGLAPARPQADPMQGNAGQGNADKKESAAPPPPADAGPPALKLVEVSAKLTPQQLAEIWNSHCGDLPRCKGIGVKRRAAMMRRIKEHPDPLVWLDAIKRIAASDFCRGDNNRGWRANIDFLLQPDTLLKVQEGSYQSNKALANGGFAGQNGAAKPPKIWSSPDDVPV